MNTSSSRTTSGRALSRRSFLSALGATAVAAPLLAACGGAAGGTASAQAYSQPDVNIPGKYSGRLPIVVWSPWGGNNGDVFAGLLEGFNESQSDIYAEVQQFDGYDGVGEKLTAGLRARQVPDVVGLSDIHWNRFFLNDTLEPLNQHQGAGFEPATYHERFFQEGVVHGESYWVPFARSTPLFYYNKEIFSAAGLPDRAPLTWDEFREWGKEITGQSYRGNSLKMRAMTGGDDWYFSGLLWAFGGGISDGLDITLDSPASIAAAEFDRSIVHDDQIAYLAQSFANDFVNGQVATITQSTGGLTSLTRDADFELGTGFLPQQADYGVPTGGGGFSITRNAAPERKEAAVELLKYLAAEEASATWSVETGYLPCTTAAVESATIADLRAQDPNYAVAVEQLDVARGPDHARRYVNATITELKDAVQSLYTQDQSSEALMQTVAEKLRREADKVREDYEEKVA